MFKKLIVIFANVVMFVYLAKSGGENAVTQIDLNFHPLGYIQLGHNKVLLQGITDHMLTYAIFEPEPRLIHYKNLMFNLPSSSCSLVLNNQTVVIVGAETGAEGKTKSIIYKLNPINFQVTILGELKYPRREHSCFKLDNGNIVVLGGIQKVAVDKNKVNFRPVLAIEEIQINSKSTVVMGKMPHPYQHFVLIDGKNILLKGYAAEPYGKYIAKSHVFLSDTKSFKEYRNLPDGSLTLLKDGRIFISGVPGSDILEQPAILNFNNQTLEFIKVNKKPSRNHKSFLLPDGRVALVAGSGNYRALMKYVSQDIIYIFDPKERTYTEAAIVSHNAANGYSIPLLVEDRLILLHGQNGGTAWIINSMLLGQGKKITYGS